MLGPQLREIEVKVFDKKWSGTDDNVKLRFKNGDEGVCSTDWLDSSSNDFQKKSLQTWNNTNYKFLSSCATLFRPTDGLHVMIELDNQAANLHSDDLQVCKIKAVFGTSDEIGSSQWRWSAQSDVKGKWNMKMYGYYLTYITEDQKEEHIKDTSAKTLKKIGWLKMCKLCQENRKKISKHCCL